MPWIDHPARQGEPASVMDWLRYRVGQWMQRVGYNMEHRALYPRDMTCPVCNGWVRPNEHCDHLPF